MTNGTFSTKQVEYLLRPLNRSRIETRKQGGATLSYLNQADVRAMAIRLFGFGNWDCRTIDMHCVFETQGEDGKWMVGYLVTMELTIRNEHGEQVCVYSESAVGGPMGPMSAREDAHDMALKTAASDAMKRCFINIGDQGGLSLYLKGSTVAMVKATIVGGAETVDTETGEMPMEPESSAGLVEPDPAPAVDPDAEEWLAELRAIIPEPNAGKRILAVAAMKQKAAGTGILDLTTQIEGSSMTYARVADMVATGAWS